MLRYRRSGVLVSLLVGGSLTLLASEDADARSKKKPETVTQDPMEAENSPPPVTPPDTGTGTTDPTKSGGSRGSSSGTSSGTSSSGGSSTGSSGSSQANSGTAGSGTNNAAAEKARAKAGRFMLNLKIGPAPCIYPSGCNTHQGALALDLGYAISADRNAYVVLPIQLQFQQNFTGIIVPVGFQYDIPLPPKGLYLYPRLLFGYAAGVTTGPSGTPNQVQTAHKGFLAPEMGLKYVLNGRFNFGGEFFSLPLFFDKDGSTLFYRIMLSAGVNF